MPVSSDIDHACREAIRTSRRGDTREGLDLARQALHRARAENNPASELAAMNTLAICQAAQVHFISALATAIDAFHLARRLDDRLAMANALTTLAGAAGFILDTQEDSLTMLARCLQSAKELGDVPLEVRVRNISGVMLGNLKRFEEGEHEFERALADIERAGENTPKSLVMGNWAHLAAKRARAAEGAARDALWQLSEQRMNLAFEVARQAGNRDAESRMYYNMGELRYQQGRYDEAGAAFEEVIRLMRDLRQQGRMIEALIDVGRIRLAQRRVDEAVPILLQAYNDAQAERPAALLSRATDHLVEAYTQLGQTAQAAQWRERGERERMEFERESAQARRQLESFWNALMARQDRPAGGSQVNSEFM